jgi:hypothetical protein
MSKEPNTLASQIAKGHVSLKTAASMIGVSYPTAIKMRDAGTLRCIKVGQIWKVTVSEIERFLVEGNYVPPAPPPPPPPPTVVEPPKSDGTGLPAYIKNLNKDQSE